MKKHEIFKMFSNILDNFYTDNPKDTNYFHENIKEKLLSDTFHCLKDINKNESETFSQKNKNFDKNNELFVKSNIDNISNKSSVFLDNSVFMDNSSKMENSSKIFEKMQDINKEKIIETFKNNLNENYLESFKEEGINYISDVSSSVNTSQLNTKIIKKKRTEVNHKKNVYFDNKLFDRIIYNKILNILEIKKLSKMVDFDSMDNNQKKKFITKIKNRISSERSREQKKVYLNELEEINNMLKSENEKFKSEIKILNEKIADFEASQNK